MVYKDLVERVCDLYGSKSASTVGHFFQAVQMPVPLKDEYTKTNDNGFLVFLDDYACVIRMTSHGHVQVEHRHVLQPVATRQAEKFRIDFNPGVICTLSMKAFQTFYAYMNNEEKIDFDCGAKENVGYVPLQTVDFPNGYPVVVDMGYVKELSKGTMSVKGLLKTSSEKKPSPPDEFYAPLKESFNRAWPANQNDSDPQKWQNFWIYAGNGKSRESLWQTGKRTRLSWIITKMPMKEGKNTPVLSER